MNSYTLVSNLFVPERVTNRICIAPWPRASAPALAVVSVTSSTASSRGATSEKKPSPDCSRLLLLMPSIVMLIVFCGSPAIVELRALPRAADRLHARQEDQEVQRVAVRRAAGSR